MPVTKLQNRDRQGAGPNTFLITFACYGSWLPGEIGTIPRTQNQFGSRPPLPNAGIKHPVKDRMVQSQYLLDRVRRPVVLNAIHSVCAHRHWSLLAAHVRTNHVHTVITAESKPEPVMNPLKAYASRALNALALDGPDRRRWARHGSTRYLWTQKNIAAAADYVLHEQGEPMSLFAPDSTTA
jgi:REP element-mobilizing transposase RayT